MEIIAEAEKGLDRQLLRERVSLLFNVLRYDSEL
jgi:hypothetical protein